MGCGGRIRESRVVQGDGSEQEFVFQVIARCDVQSCTSLNLPVDRHSHAVRDAAFPGTLR
jgi:hypothetical protein